MRLLTQEELMSDVRFRLVAAMRPEFVDNVLLAVPGDATLKDDTPWLVSLERKGGERLVSVFGDMTASTLREALTFLEEHGAQRWGEL
jgi:hypothetical protein